MSGSGAGRGAFGLYAVIMAGGGGTRFWPLSRRARPKQFLAVTGSPGDGAGDRTLLQLTWDRAVAVAGGPDRVLVVTGRDYEALTREQLPALGAENLLLEPQARNTAPCIAWAAAELGRRDSEATMAVLPADHLIRDVEGFVSDARTAAAAARRHGVLVTFGIPPRYPETGYGYIELDEAPGKGGEHRAGEELGTGEERQAGEELETGAGREAPGAGPSPVHRVVSFREKPDRTTAEAWVEAGNYVWNSGIFVWTTEEILAALERHLGEAREAASRMVEAAGDDAARAAAWAAMPATSIDFGVMERAGNVACVRASFDWSDVGSWEALYEVSEGSATDADGNVSRGTTVALDARNNLVHAPGELVALLGVEGLAVVRAGDTLLVARLDRAQEVKALRQRLVELGLEDHL